jgi:uncharacterized protein
VRHCPPEFRDDFAALLPDRSRRMPGRGPELGVGLVWWPPLDVLCRDTEGLVGVVEAEPEAFWFADRRGDGSAGFQSTLPQALDGLAQPKLLHGVAAPFGGCCPAPPGHIETFAGDVAHARPIWVSEHLSFSSFHHAAAGEAAISVFAGVLLPPLQSREGVAAAAQNIANRREALRTPVAFETGVNYLPPRPDEMSDGAFAAAVAEAADCGILLDLHNLYCNQRNGRQTVAEFCSALPLERVWELHLAGGELANGFLLDAHSGTVEPELMELAADLVPRLPNLGAIIFEIMPDHVPILGVEAIAKQLGSLNDLWVRRSRSAVTAAGGSQAQRRLNSLLALDEWETLLGREVVGWAQPCRHEELADWWQAAAPARGVYRQLSEEGRAGMVAVAAPQTVRALLKELGPAGARALLGQFWSQAPPARTAIEEAHAFIRHLSAATKSSPSLDQAIANDTVDMAEFVGRYARSTET